MERLFQLPRKLLVIVGIAAVGMQFPLLAARRTFNLRLAAAPPTASATKDKPLAFKLSVPDPKNPRKEKIVTVMVKDIPKQMAGETDTQASVRKAKAIAAAINKELPGSASVKEEPTIVAGPNGPMIVNQGVAYVKGVTGYTGISDPTGEPGGGIGFGPPNGVPAPQNPPSYKGSMGGPGKNQGYSTGRDGTGAQSLDAFGFFTDDFSQIDIATVSPSPGETDSQVLTDLAQEFNSTFGSNGYSATYDSGTDTLSLNQALTIYESLFVANTDAGLDLVQSLEPMPEPRPIVLLGVGLIGLACLRRQLFGKATRE